MEFRVTVGLGQDSMDTNVLEQRAAEVQRSAAGVGDGPDPVVVVDLVKAAVQLVFAVEADDALTACQGALTAAGRSLREAHLRAPTTVVTMEAEAVPVPAHDQPLRPHPARTDNVDNPVRNG